MSGPFFHSDRENLTFGGIGCVVKVQGGLEARDVVDRASCSLNFSFGILRVERVVSS